MSDMSLDEGLCADCLYKFVDGSDRQRDRASLLKSLQERVRRGLKRGNAGAVEYPNGLDYELMRLLDLLRIVQARIRLTTRNRFSPDDDQLVVRDGHLRRVSAEDEFSGMLDGKLGLFVSPRSLEPLSILEDEDYDRLVKIICIDPLLLGSDLPKALWQMPLEPPEESQRRQQECVAKARRQALMFATHMLLAVAIFIGMGVAFLTTLLNQQWLDAAVWGSYWFLASIIAGVSVVEMWDGPPWPYVSLIWRRAR